MPLRHPDEGGARQVERPASEASQLHLATPATKTFDLSPHVVSDPKLACIIPSAQLHPATIRTCIAKPFGTPTTNATSFVIHPNLVEELHATILRTGKPAPTTEA